MIGVLCTIEFKIADRTLLHSPLQLRAGEVSVLLRIVHVLSPLGYAAFLVFCMNTFLDTFLPFLPVFGLFGVGVGEGEFIN